LPGPTPRIAPGSRPTPRRPPSQISYPIPSFASPGSPPSTEFPHPKRREEDGRRKTRCQLTPWRSTSPSSPFNSRKEEDHPRTRNPLTGVLHPIHPIPSFHSSAPIDGRFPFEGHTLDPLARRMTINFHTNNDYCSYPTLDSCPVWAFHPPAVTIIYAVISFLSQTNTLTNNKG
jgi:hypothetical protein